VTEDHDLGAVARLPVTVQQLLGDAAP